MRIAIGSKDVHQGFMRHGRIDVCEGSITIGLRVAHESGSYARLQSIHDVSQPAHTRDDHARWLGPTIIRLGATIEGHVGLAATGAATPKRLVVPLWLLTVVSEEDVTTHDETLPLEFATEVIH